MRAADEAGFDAFFLPEFHQTRAGGVISPLLTGAALAEGTRRIRVGQAVVPGPLYHPVRLAGDVAMLSWLTRGRALLGVGVGHLPADFEDLVAPGRFLYGDGQELRAQIAGWRERTGMEYLALRMRQPGGPVHEATLAALARFGEEVIRPMQEQAP